ncbi:MAG: HAD-IIB family hydrolase [Pseudomonadota bacterium]|nr:HAD-IIB family hydrolase [Pseudomonadota bacterium]
MTRIAKPWSQCPPATLRRVAGLFTDIDDTLTRAGAIDPPALAALHDLRRAGLPVVAITGRPLGWSEPFARAWPLDAIVAENGGVALIRDSDGQGSDGLHIEFAQEARTRAANHARLQAALARVLRDVPGASAAADSAGRVTDIAIDHSEFTQLAPEQIDQVAALMRAEGLHATVSSIHINGWIGEHDKLSAAHWMVRRLYGRELSAEIDRWIYIGDSPNDQRMFEAFALSVGVANLRCHAALLQQWPRWITVGERGAGVAEVAARLLEALAA